MSNYKNKSESEININYLSKDFSSLRKDLINYAKTYFPDTYNDFNETSPGMMMMEMSAYVGDILSFYIDQQFKETSLSTAEERRNIINLAKSLGYKVKSTVPALVELVLKQSVDAITSDVSNVRPNYDQTLVLDSGLSVQSTSDSTVFFETLDIVDFSVSGSGYSAPTVLSTDSSGLVETYELKRKVLAVSGKTKEKTFTVSTPQEFLKLTLPDTNVINIISVTDSNGKNWHEVDYLAEDKISDFVRRNDPYGGNVVASSFQLNTYKSTNKRFIIDVDSDNKTSLIFGNGTITKDITRGYVEEVFGDNQEINALIQGSLPSSIDPSGQVTYKSLGESPSNTTLTIKYRTGGGIKSNVPVNDLTTIVNKSVLNDLASKGEDEATVLNTLSSDNEQPARGGLDKESVDDIREKTKLFFKSQDRCVTKSDYEARVLSLPPKFGSIAKVFANRNTFGTTEDVADLSIFDIDNSGNFGGSADSDAFNTLFSGIINGSANDTPTINQNQIDKLQQISTFIENIPETPNDELLSFKNIKIYVLSYDQNKNLVQTPTSIKTNIANYLNEFKILSDEVRIADGKVINFGVKFNVVAHDDVNKSELKLRVIDEIINYFNIDDMKFNQIIYTSDLENKIYGLEGVKVVKELKLTQDANILGLSSHLVYPGGLPTNGVGGENSSEYGWAFSNLFADFYTDNGVSENGNGVILPSHIDTSPAVFELKNPYDNVRGVIQ
tara:strand:+ start:4773 stop:6947 length:2175 start_codon:yes stop_codon:yes gene_type:complete